MSHSFPSPAKPLDEQAADWAARLDGGPLSPGEADALQTWLDAAPDHEALLEEFQRLHGQVRATLPVMARAGRLPTPIEVAAPRPAWTWARGLAAAAAVAALGLWYFYSPQNLATSAAQRQMVTLADGSVAELNARTSLAVSLRGHDRRVRLSAGEAYFSVAKDPSRPFYVETPAGTVRVTGTHFNVRADDPATLEVTVIEGSVAVETSPGTDYALKPQDRLEFDGAKAEVQKLTPEDTEDAIAWRQGRIVFDGVPVRVALERFARYHGREIDVSPLVETLRLGGRFKLDDFDGFLRDVEKAVPVRVLRGESDRIRIVPR
jgi:transmembrane sensor